MNDLQETLVTSFPLVLLLTALAAAIIFFPQNMDIRQRASEPAPVVQKQTAVPTLNPSYQLEPLTACTDLYQPVCGQDGLTYSSSCEALNAGVVVLYETACIPGNQPSY
jgi:hypothetical protein